MGIYIPEYYIWKHYLDIFLKTHTSKVSILELGDQSIYNPLIGINDQGWSLAKDYFVSQGFNHTSYDVHGKNGSLVVDLSKEIMDPVLLGPFDIVTNFGTTEHVEDDQYIAWKNIHKLLKPGGYLFSATPKAKEFHPFHSPWYYTTDFFHYFADTLGYKRLAIGETLQVEQEYGMAIFAALEKTEDKPFSLLDKDKFYSFLYKNPDKFQRF